MELKESTDFLPYKENPKFIVLSEKIRADVHQKRTVVIDYLKGQGEWQREWDSALD